MPARLRTRQTSHVANRSRAGHRNERLAVVHGADEHREGPVGGWCGPGIHPSPARQVGLVTLHRTARGADGSPAPSRWIEKRGCTECGRTGSNSRCPDRIRPRPRSMCTPSPVPREIIRARGRKYEGCAPGGCAGPRSAGSGAHSTYGDRRGRVIDAGSRAVAVACCARRGKGWSSAGWMG